MAVRPRAGGKPAPRASAHAQACALALRAITRPTILAGGPPAQLAALRGVLEAQEVHLAVTIDGRLRRTWTAGEQDEVVERLRPPMESSPQADVRAAEVVGVVSAQGAADPDAAAVVLRYVAGDLGDLVRRFAVDGQVARRLAQADEDSNRLAQFMGAAPDGLALVNADGRVTAWNDAMAELTGVPREQALLRPFAEVARLRDDDGTSLDAGLPGVLIAALDGRDAGRETWEVDRGGHRVWVELACAPTGGAGAPTGAVVLARDVTARRDLENLKDDFLATVSHEIRTPLTPVRAALEMLLRQPDLGVDQREQLYASMDRQVTRLDRLVRDFVTAADLGADLLTGGRGRLDLAVLVGTVVAGSGGADRVEVVAPNAVPVVSVQAAVARIVDAIVDNALRHTQGRVEVGAALDEQGGALLTVRDHGAGIPRNQVAAVFEPFGRLGSHLRRPQGVGLGLTIVRALCEQLGAQLEIQSSPDPAAPGTTVSVRLPTASA